MSIVPVEQSPFLAVRRVEMSAPLRWLALGWRDLKRAPGPSLAFGAAFALMGLLIVLVFRNAFEYVAALASGFLLVGPFVATGCYEIGRRLERGEQVRLVDAAMSWRPRATSLGLFALVLMVVLLVWARASLVTFAMFFSTGMPTLEGFVGRVFSLEHLDFVFTWLVEGAIFATLVYCAGVVTVPSMLDRGTDTVPAVLDSFRACIANPGPMALWAVMIALLVGGGVATGFIGLVVTGPLMGLATWHAYRELFGPPDSR